MICVVFFLGFIATMFGVSVWCVANGNPSMLLNPYDFEGNICGLAGQNPLNKKNYDMRNYDYLYLTYVNVDYSAG